MTDRQHQQDEVVRPIALSGRSVATLARDPTAAPASLAVGEGPWRDTH
jgi:hypothetical protein